MSNETQAKPRGRPSKNKENNGNRVTVSAARKLPAKKVPAGAKAINVSAEYQALAGLANTVAKTLPTNICAIIHHQTEQGGAVTSIEVRRS